MLAEQRRTDALIVLNPSASKANKCWPAARWVEVADELADAGDLVIVGSGAEVERHAEIARRVAVEVCDLTGRTTLAEMVALLERCTLHVGHDTGTSQIAAALGTPVVSIFGPTEPRRTGALGSGTPRAQARRVVRPTCPRLCPYRRRCLAASASKRSSFARRAGGASGATSVVLRREDASPCRSAHFGRRRAVQLAVGERHLSVSLPTRHDLEHGMRGALESAGGPRRSFS